MILKLTHVVTDKCIDCKFTTCVDVCPVDAFHEGINMLVINPTICIDCGMCVDECPISAIVTDNSDDVRLDEYIDYAERAVKIWPTINKIKSPISDQLIGEDKWSNRPKIEE